MAEQSWRRRFESVPHRRGLFAAVLALVLLVILWWLVDDWYQDSLVAEATGHQEVVRRLIFTFRAASLLIIGLGGALTYLITSRQTRLSQTVEVQAEELTERLEQYHSIFETTGEGLVIRDMQTLAIVDANPAYCQLHQTSREALIGQTAAIAVDTDLYPQYVDIIKQRGQHRWEGPTQLPDGSTVYLEALGTTITYQGKPHLLVAVRDVTERVQAQRLLEKRVAERTRELETLLQITHNLTATLELKALLSLILEQGQQVVNYTSAVIFKLSDNRDELTLMVFDTPGPNNQVPPQISLATRPVYARIIRERQPVIISDTSTDTESWGGGSGDMFAQVNSWLGVPLVIKDRAIGMLEFGHQQAGYYTPYQAQLALAFANQAAVAIENARLYEQAQTLASLEERRHLARELHDSVSQALYGIALGTRTARMLMDRDPGKLAEPLDYIMNLAEAGLSEMRALIFELRPEVLESEGLVVALAKQAESLRARHNLEIVTHFPDEPEALLSTKETLYRIAQEATHNIVKHAKASQVEISLASGRELTLQISDNGQGFDPGQSFPGHLGLQSMRERAEKLGGQFELTSTPGAGTVVRARMPITSSV